MVLQKLSNADADADADADVDADARGKETCSGSQILTLILTLSFSSPGCCCRRLLLLSSFLRYRCHGVMFRCDCIRAGDGVGFWCR